ncbi:unnamed protein product, partial [Iphiclides podalirius]
MGGENIVGRDWTGLKAGHVVSAVPLELSGELSAARDYRTRLAKSVTGIDWPRARHALQAEMTPKASPDGRCRRRCRGSCGADGWEWAGEPPYKLVTLFSLHLLLGGGPILSDVGDHHTELFSILRQSTNTDGVLDVCPFFHFTTFT